MREESEKWNKKVWFKTTAEDGEKEGSSDVGWNTVPQMSGCEGKKIKVVYSC